MAGDVSLSAEDLWHPGSAKPSMAKASELAEVPVDHEVEWDGDEHDADYEHDEHEHEPEHHWLGGTTALKFLLAGGIAGAGAQSLPMRFIDVLADRTKPPVSRTATAPFDRLKIFLITRPPDLGGTALTNLTPKASLNGVKAIVSAVVRIYAEGGVRGFWIGNGLSVTKIFPESAIKFLMYESSVSPLASADL